MTVTMTPRWVITNKPVLLALVFDALRTLSRSLSLSHFFSLSLSLSVSLSPGSAASVKPPVAIGRLIAASRGGGGG